MQQGHVINVGVGSSSSMAFVMFLLVKSVERVNRLLDPTSNTVCGHSVTSNLNRAFFSHFSN